VTDPAPPSRPAWLPRVDSYDLRARFVPALLVAAPALALALVLPLGPLHGAQRLWSLLGLAVVPLAAAVVRRLGHAAQPLLFAAWGGAPTTQRLRWASAARRLVAARHTELRTVLGSRLPLATASAERKDPAAADALYADAVRRLLGLTRHDDRFRLLHRENANYGFARNLYGARPLGIAVSAGSLLTAAAVAVYLVMNGEASAAAPLLLPALVALAALLAWRLLVTPALVRAPADAFADRVLEALQTLAQDRASRRGADPDGD
jgi:hypothetical protein